MLTNNRADKRDALDSSLFHKLSGGDPESFVSQVFVLLDEVLQKQRQIPVSEANGNGVFPGRGGVASKKDLQRIEQQMAQALQAIQKLEKPKPEHWTSRGIKFVVAGLILIGLGYLICLTQLHADGDARVDRIIHTQMKAYEVPLWLISHNGSIYKGPITPSEGHSETQGIILCPGESKLSAPWVTDKGYIVVPIR